MIRRRDFVTLLGGAAAAWPLAVRAQQRALPVLGYLNGGSPEQWAHLVTAFRKGLGEAGYVEGRNLEIEYRWANNEYDRLPELAGDLVRRQVAAIVTVGTVAPILAAKAATATIPIVFATGVDPVASGVVASLNRPGGNVTGVTGIAQELGGKQLGLLHEMVPSAVRFAMLVNPDDPLTQIYVTNAQAAASKIGVQLEILTAATNREIDAAFARLAEKPAAALLVDADLLFISRRVQLANLTVKHGLIAMFSFREQVDAGGLMSYGPNMADVNHQVGIYAARILKGEKPGDLPVMLASKFEFLINLQTARTLGVEIPPTLLALADEVIE